ncbi:hypothetical protein SDC9_109653 [bioreactor metagenome]|uniref:Terminase small subunit n=1 Tax=bioreactor metagenome TaxID=1076179 RepID=A0A645BBE7_9ZZZZ|nr:terminase small subunit [Aminivibrio sp.]MEA4952723.1 terminase small subunit [Aminivibrio sp.]
MLTTKQRRFVESYSGNASEAARLAGYAPRWADRQAHTLIEKNREIREAIQKREEQRRSELIADRTRRQMFWSRIMNDESESMATRLRASELLAKSEGDFLDRVRLDGNFDVAMGLACLLQEVSLVDRDG